VSGAVSTGDASLLIIAFTLLLASLIVRRASVFFLSAAVISLLVLMVNAKPDPAGGVPSTGSSLDEVKKEITAIKADISQLKNKLIDQNRTHGEISPPANQKEVKASERNNKSSNIKKMSNKKSSRSKKSRKSKRR
jgi:hypothetical protein